MAAFTDQMVQVSVPDSDLIVRIHYNHSTLEIAPVDPCPCRDIKATGQDARLRFVADRLNDEHHINQPLRLHWDSHEEALMIITTLNDAGACSKMILGLLPQANVTDEVVRAIAEANERLAAWTG